MKKIQDGGSRKCQRDLPKKNRDMPATVGLVLEVREELRADLRGLEARMDSRFAALEAKMDSRFSGIDGRFAEIDGRFAEIDVRFSEIDARFSAQGSKIEQILAAVHRTQAIVEEQRSENRVMLEALNGFVQRMDHLEKRQDDNDATLRTLARSARPLVR